MPEYWCLNVMCFIASTSSVFGRVTSTKAAESIFNPYYRLRNNMENETTVKRVSVYDLHRGTESGKPVICQMFTCKSQNDTIDKIFHRTSEGLGQILTSQTASNWNTKQLESTRKTSISHADNVKFTTTDRSPILKETTLYDFDIKKCRFLTFKPREVYTIYMRSSGVPANESKHCYGELMVPAKRFIYVSAAIYGSIVLTCEGIGSSLIFTERNEMKVRQRITPCDKSSVVCGNSNVLQFVFSVFTVRSVHARIVVESAERNCNRFLEIRKLPRGLGGTVSTYGFSFYSMYPREIGASAALLPLPGYSVMLSFPHFDIDETPYCLGDGFTMLFESGFQGFVKAQCGVKEYPPMVQVGYVHIIFFTDKIGRKSGFKISFTYHAPLEVPQKIGFNKDSDTYIFNCSVSFFRDFDRHLACNLQTECINGEDEINCPYSNGPCKKGFVYSGKQCLKYVKTKKIMTWYDAAEECRKQDLSLVTTTNNMMWEDFFGIILIFTARRFKTFFGLKTSEPSLPSFYREVWQWSTGTMAYSTLLDQKKFFKPACAVINPLSTKTEMSATICGSSEFIQFIFCEETVPKPLSSTANFSASLSNNFQTPKACNGLKCVSCAKGHLTYDFLSCDAATDCGGSKGAALCMTMSDANDLPKGDVTVRMFVCDVLTQTIHYTQVCDHRPQCLDSSDESFCVHRKCPEKECPNKQCVPYAKWCDGMADCSDGSDENCPQFVEHIPKTSMHAIPEVYFDGFGSYNLTVFDAGYFGGCPSTHFYCECDSVCLPVFLWCNGIYDCSDHRDENKCADYVCPGFYRCRGSPLCVHVDNICDGMFQCPDQDDELLCNFDCPQNCFCQGLAFICPKPFLVELSTEIRYLDATGSGMEANAFDNNYYLAYLKLSSCGLKNISQMFLPNLKIFDLSANVLTNVNVESFRFLANLNFVTLSENPLALLFTSTITFDFQSLHTLDLSYTNIRSFKSQLLSLIPNLKFLNFSHSSLEIIPDDGFGAAKQIELLDLRGLKLKQYPLNILQPLSSLKEVYTDEFKLCCQEVLPLHFGIKGCHAKPDELASCTDLLQSDIYRICLWIFSSFSVVGNVASFVFRFYLHKGMPQNSFNIFITNLNIADLCMGVYLTIVGIADWMYGDEYLWYDVAWRKSVVCHIAGFFSLLSCETSTFIICFITLDRFLVLRFPFSHIHFRKTSALVVCLMSWLASFVLALVPLLPITSHWGFYGQTGICIPLPITREDFKGHFYSFGILVLLNFMLFMLIAVGQVFIYISIQQNSMSTDNRSSRESVIARRLITVVISDFVCWFPIGLLGLLASNNVSIPSKINVAMAIFVLPLNSALNPFLYTFNTVMEKRRKAREERLLKRLQATARKSGNTNANSRASKEN